MRTVRTMATALHFSNIYPIGEWNILYKSGAKYSAHTRHNEEEEKRAGDKSRLLVEF